MNGENAIHCYVPLYYIREDSERNEAYLTGSAGAIDTQHERGVLGSWAFGWLWRGQWRSERFCEMSFGKARDLVSSGQCMGYRLYCIGVPDDETSFRQCALLLRFVVFTVQGVRG